MHTSADSIKSLYQRESWTSSYDEVRFGNKGGQYINEQEIQIVWKALNNLPEHASVLDVAAGTGRFTVMLASKGFQMTAFDASSSMLEIIQKKSESLNLSIRLIEGDVRELPFHENQFQGVCCLRFLWHCDDWRNIVDLLLNCSCGPVVLDLMNHNSLRRYLRPFAIRKAYEVHTTQREAETYFHAKAFKILNRKTAFAFPFFIYRRFPWLTGFLAPIDRWLSKKGLGSMLYYTLEKS